MENVRLPSLIFAVALGFSLLGTCVSVFLSVRNSHEVQLVLEQDMEELMLANTYAARGLINAPHLALYKSLEDLNNDEEDYAKVLSDLRDLADKSRAEYYYVLKNIDGKYVFIFDTDTKSDTRMHEYKLSPVHEQAFEGNEASGIKNVNDEWGTYSTAALPIFNDGEVVGIVAADFNVDGINRTHEITKIYSIVMICAMSTMTILMVVALLHLLRKYIEAQDKLYRIANYDALTDLPNRRYLMEHLQALTTAPASKRRPFALLFVDLDNFKHVNDSDGHDVGDALLREIATCLHDTHGKASPRVPIRRGRGDDDAGDVISARVGGDEFVQVLPGIDTGGEAEEAARRLLAAFNGCSGFTRFVDAYKVGLSIGIALFPMHATDSTVLVKCADIAMYHAKRGGKNNYCLFSEGMEGADVPMKDRHFRHDERQDV
ncbi:MAG: GGDEF domain-containing protein [Desulfovibrio sp.]|nr:GGDEF domain-containing protein [Desulfovibrio sp.]